jgi:hypothetical protein
MPGRGRPSKVARTQAVQWAPEDAAWDSPVGVGANGVIAARPIHAITRATVSSRPSNGASNGCAGRSLSESARPAEQAEAEHLTAAGRRRCGGTARRHRAASRNGPLGAQHQRPCPGTWPLERPQRSRCRRRATAAATVRCRSPGCPRASTCGGLSACATIGRPDVSGRTGARAAPSKVPCSWGRNCTVGCAGYHASPARRAGRTPSKKPFHKPDT